MKHLVPLTLLLTSLTLLPAAPAHAHCDTMDGPVITAARKALETRNVNFVLIWVQPGDEALIREAFHDALARRKPGGAAAEAADHAFFEHLVRIHRAGEGASFDGIKPAGQPLDPAVRAADHALETGSPQELTATLQTAIDKGVQERYALVRDKKSFDPNDVAAGREYVKAYVSFTHYAEGVHQAASSNGAHHEHASPAHDHHAHAAAAKLDHSHSGHEGHVPWLLAGLFGLVVVGQNGWLVMRRKKASS